jgi:tRNA pseudouridine32 synthase/23S rRNA pseudouridine746 synthase
MGWQADANAFVPLPVRDGVGPSFLWLQKGPWATMLEFLLDRYPHIGEAEWLARMARGDVVDGAGVPYRPDSPYRKGARLWYYRTLPAETPVPFEETILHLDEHLLVADKPHFLATVPTGRFLHESLLVRLKKRTGLHDLTPVHRLDRETAGVVMFSVNPATRGAYQSMFQKRSVHKVYEALAGPMRGRSFPFVHRSLMVDSDQFFLMKEVPGEPNSETLVDVIGQQDGVVHYRLEPHTGRKHQLRVHMASLGAPIMNDTFYPAALPPGEDDFSRPLKLLARTVSFTDPITGQERSYSSLRKLLPGAAGVT